jgi:hypothetical protein
MKVAIAARSVLAAGAIVAAFGLASSVASAAPADDSAQAAAPTKSPQVPVTAKAKHRARIIRRSAEQTGLMQLPMPVTIGATTYYWYRPVAVSRGSARPRQMYVISPGPPPPGSGWQCCLILGIAY